MPQAVASPEDLERFARELKQFNAQLRESMSRLQGQFSRLGDTWLLDLNDYEWEEVNPALSPPARSDLGMACNGSDHIVLLFGGTCLENQPDLCDDTWVFDPESNRWIQMNPHRHRW